MLFAIKNKVIPVVAVVSAIGFIWYGFTIYLNSPWQIQNYEKSSIEWSFVDLAKDTMAHERPIYLLPTKYYLKFGKPQLKKRSHLKDH